jgi:MarR family transcriptional regulator for hemolysin
MTSPSDLPNFSETLPSESVQEKLGIAIGDVNRLWRDRLNSRLKPLGLSHSKWRALLYLARTSKGMTQTELARMLSIEAPTVTRLVKQLEESGWLTRHASPEDARWKLVHLTAKAKQIVVQIEVEVRKLRAETLGRLDAEEAAAGLAALQTVHRYLREL